LTTETCFIRDFGSFYAYTGMLVLFPVFGGQILVHLLVINILEILDWFCTWLSKVCQLTHVDSFLKLFRFVTCTYS